MSVSKRAQAGDTIIEVTVAFVIFALLAVGASMIMNRGVSSAQDALETTLVRGQLDGQAETLRYFYQNYISDPQGTSLPVKVFQEIITNYTVDYTVGASDFSSTTCTTTPPSSSAFALSIPTGLTPSVESVIFHGGEINSIDDSNVATPDPVYSQFLSGVARGIWIEGVKGDNGGTGADFYDFHIRACWYPSSGDIPRTLGTIVRFYVS